MAGARRISADEARRDLEAGRALLVCAYDDDAKCDRMRLDGALSLSELRAREATLPRTTELLFYCA